MYVGTGYSNKKLRMDTVPEFIPKRVCAVRKGYSEPHKQHFADQSLGWKLENGNTLDLFWNTYIQSAVLMTEKVEESKLEVASYLISISR